jgi:excisionase family DNA binding protein
MGPSAQTDVHRGLCYSAMGLLSIVVGEVGSTGQEVTTVSERQHELLTVREIADAMRVSTMTVYRLIRAGALPAIRVGKHFRIRARDLDEYLEAQTLGGGDAWPAA